MIDSRLTLKAAIGSGIVLVLLAVSVAIGGLRIFDRSYTLSTIVEDAAGLESGDPVRVAGVNIGSVNAVTRIPEEGTLEVRFNVSADTEISTSSIASIRLRTLLGKKFLNLDDPGSGPMLAAGDVIPISQTERSTDVDTLLNAAEPTIEATDVDGINRLLTSVDRTLAGRGDQLRNVFGQLGELAGTFGDREAELDRLITSTNQLASVVDTRDAELRQVLDGMDLVLSSLATRGSSLTRLVDQVSSLDATLSPLIAGNEAEFTHLFNGLNTVSDILVRQYDRLDIALSQLPDLAERFYAVTREGSWVNVYIVGVVATPFLANPVDLGSSAGGEPGETGGAPRLQLDPPQLLPSTEIGGIKIDTEDNRTIFAPEGFGE